jgi:hypothetical protein
VLPPGFTLDPDQQLSAQTAPQAQPQPDAGRRSIRGRLDSDSQRWNRDQDAALSSLFQGAIVDPAAGLSQLGAHGAAWAAGKVGSDHAQDFTKGLADAIDQTVAQQNQRYEAQRQAAGAAPDSIDVGRIAGNIFSPFNVAAGVRAAALAENVPTALGRMLLRGAGTGAAIAAAEPVRDSGNYWGDKGNQLMWGAGVGGVTEPVAAALGRALQGVTDPQKRLLLDEGVPLTTGQMLADVKPGQAASGVWKATEDKMASAPLLGDMIKERQAEASLGLNKAALNRVLEPLGEELPRGTAMGRDALDYVNGRVSDRYDQALTHLSGQLDTPLQNDLYTVTQQASKLPPDQFNQFKKIRDDYVLGQFQANSPFGQFTGPINGNNLKGVDSELGKISRGLAKDPGYFNQQLGQRVEDLQDSFRQMIQRVNQNSPHVDALNQANAAYAQWVRVRDAAKTANNGVFSPAQLSGAAVRDARTANQAATGNGIMQDLADAGRAVLPQSVGNSGTTDRRNLTELAMALLGGHAAGVGPGVMLGGLAGIGAYSQPGQALMRSVMAGSPQTRQMLAEILNRTPVTRSAVAAQNQMQGAQ